MPPGCSRLVEDRREPSSVKKWPNAKVAPSWCSETTDNAHGAKLPENLANIALSGQNGTLINGSATSKAVSWPKDR